MTNLHNSGHHLRAIVVFEPDVAPQGQALQPPVLVHRPPQPASTRTRRAVRWRSQPMPTAPVVRRHLAPAGDCLREIRAKDRRGAARREGLAAGGARSGAPDESLVPDDVPAEVELQQLATTPSVAGSRQSTRRHPSAVGAVFTVAPAAAAASAAEHAAGPHAPVGPHGFQRLSERSRAGVVAATAAEVEPPQPACTPTCSQTLAPRR